MSDGDNTTLLMDIYQRLAIVETQNSQIMAAQGRAEDSRQSLHDKVNRFSIVAQTVERLEPIVVRMEQKWAAIEGASRLGSAIAKMIWAAVGAITIIAGWFAHAFLGGQK